MLESVRMDFQCHVGLELELDQITVLVGDNGVGKSAVLRGLEWLMLNTWEGKASEYVPWNRELAEVGIRLDGKSITRRRSADSNIYLLDHQEFRAFGKGVPEPIAAALHVTDGNFQHQGEPAFWLSLGPAQLAQALNGLFHLEQIDEAQARMGMELRQARTVVSVSESRWKEASMTEKQLEWVTQADEMLAELESLEESGRQDAIQLAQLEVQRRRLESALVSGEHLDELIAMGEAVVRAGEVVVDLETQLEDLCRAVKMEEELARTAKLLQTRSYELRVLLRGKCPLCQRG